MKIIIVTGKSGSGKSEVSKKLAEKLNCPLIVLDNVSHLSLEDNKIKFELINRFGNKILNKNRIDRKTLGKIIFNYPADLEFVNRLSWKFIDDFVDEKISTLKSDYLILDYALLPLMKYFKMSDYKILVVARKNVRLERLKNRDNVDADYLNSREAHSLEYNEHGYDFVLDNTDLSLEELSLEVEKIAKKIQI